MCEANMHDPEMHHCQKSLGQPKHELDDCVIDLSHIIEEAGQQEYLKTMVAKYQHHCPHHKLGFKHHPRPKHIPNHKPVKHPHQRHRPMYDHRPRDSSEEPDSREGSNRPRPRPRPDSSREGPNRHRGVPKFLHEKFGPPKPEHKGQCFTLKKQFQKDGFKLLECLKFEEFFDED